MNSPFADGPVCACAAGEAPLRREPSSGTTGVEEVDVLGEAAAALLGDTDARTGDTDACQQSFVP